MHMVQGVHHDERGLAFGEPSLFGMPYVKHLTIHSNLKRSKRALVQRRFQVDQFHEDESNRSAAGRQVQGLDRAWTRPEAVDDPCAGCSSTEAMPDCAAGTGTTSCIVTCFLATGNFILY